MEFKEPKAISRFQGDGECLIELSGDWLFSVRTIDSDPILSELKDKNINRIKFDPSSLGVWDSEILTFLTKIKSFADNKKIIFEDGSLPDGIRKLLKLSAAVPVVEEGEKHEIDMPILERIGTTTLKVKGSAQSMIQFVGEVTLSIGRFLRGKAMFQKSDLFLYTQQAGVQALPIVTLINLLIGLILAFVGAIQLQMFGAEIYVADLVAIGMVREMAAMMTAIIMAGRSGAAYAAQLGTMMVNEEIDALETFGINPIDFLVLPRILALASMVPLLSLYAGFIGILGGLLVSIFMLDISATQYMTETIAAITPVTFLLGLIKATIYGILVAFAGCYRGMQSGRSSAAVGASTTSAVVTAIVMIIVASAVTTIIFFVIGV
ncbi:MAG: ABC transporter permease [Chlorobi bacterium]|nr:ABC transporter permease [Chlorobiota bacterium]